ncbi:hypothetical protein HanRHA438_Chr15g0730971 [Helianthus annuus]|uniref:DUF7950 domain-containing protein n=1 Tax=Helianthus annuus TaxID=4232 RepID=A0A251SCC8_HELAN|nr:AF4/FMR2 family member lilli [Helianthus annuus]KAF5766709.1 hypothetical protein HanXRQr2_Chr15g0718651 [Helianthus annuus]KAJ0453062.1 hypothetical protein HanHA300_Chr15g0586131 [Helianthus annuus]KAJ0474972.1 hypothetical protein HanHA89_Chr15g0635871 [Helianthus annuus]KAJ0650527.1 hypothetical protein HanLR1_Chr15g0596781 [Helianthus annuus]KAJ0654280.1 hypothetical protein HanOQP8_Chr15g0593201 [Helianthus annuus]
MLQTLNPYTPTAKTAEIMARYRPIAPKPQASNAAGGGGGNSPNAGGGDEGSGSGSGASGSRVSGSGSCSSPPSMSPTIRQSPYLRNVWPHLQLRPTRTRKRGRTSLGPPPAAFKRPRTLLQGLSPPFHITSPPARTISIQGFAPTTLVTLPLLPTHPMQSQPDVIDLNKAAEIPEEKDLLAQLQKPTSNVISPTPNRLVSSTVSIRAVKLDDTGSSGSSRHITLKKPEEIEKELESQTLPAFVSDSNNRVRLVNSSYQNMVGQPNCGWVESMVTGEVACRSICGNVVLDFVDLKDEDDDLRVCSGGFSCWARIEWGANGKRNIVNAFGEGMRVACESKDYKFAWRFHRRQGGADVLQD